jgi:hypothetical protein
MANAPDVTDPEHPISKPGDPRLDAHLRNPVVVILHWDTPYLGGLQYSVFAAAMGHTQAFKDKVAEAYEEFINKLRYHIACGRYVIIRGYSPQHRVMWERQSVQTLKGSLDQEIDHQGAYLCYLFTFMFLICW